ncbi:phage portal protein [Priestia megaterium]
MGFFKRGDGMEKRGRTFTFDQQEMIDFFTGIENFGNTPANEATFYTCLRVLADAISSLGLDLFQETDKGMFNKNAHYLNYFLKVRPNVHLSPSVFWTVVVYQMYYHGQSVVYIDIDKITGQIKGLYPLDMKSVQILADDKGIFGSENSIYYVYSVGGQQLYLKETQCLNFMSMTTDGITGIAIKDQLRTVVENSQHGQNFVNKQFKNGLTASAVLQYTGDISRDNERAMKERFERMANTPENIGKLVTMPLGFSLQPIKSTMVDSQFLELNELSIQMIANAFGVKGYHLGKTSTFTNVEQQQEDFYRNTLAPILTKFEQELTFKCLTEKEVKSGFKIKFNTSELLRSDPKTRAEVAKLYKEAGIISAAEARKDEGRPVYEADENSSPAERLTVNGATIFIDQIGMQWEKQQEQEEPTDNKEGTPTEQVDDTQDNLEGGENIDSGKAEGDTED